MPISTEASRSRPRARDRSVRDVMAEALAQWLDRREDEEDRASAAEALAEYRRDGGTSAAEAFAKLAAETKAEYGSDR